MDDNKEIQEALEKAGDVILTKIMMKRKDFIEKGYKPQSLIIWEGYFKALVNASNLQYSHSPGIDAKKILGLEIIKTQLPDILEVY